MAVPYTQKNSEIGNDEVVKLTIFGSYAGVGQPFTGGGPTNPLECSGPR